MSDHSSNDNQSRPIGSRGTDAHGRAAMLLVETLIHVLIARSILTVADAVELVDDAVDVSRAIALEVGDHSQANDASVTLLMAISRSLRADLQRT